ncbi:MULTISPECIES: hypothetical protein [Psychrobacter]|uniref:tetratricopeptide repeat protein n=1 Tax=Psychrobacter TaxID=497 RepID=UPI00146C7A75|nr:MULTISPECIES: hypothetical protein [Psychrobacter]
MTAQNHSITTLKKTLSLSALAAACAMTMSVSSIAATSPATDASAVPSAVDSSQRVIRRATSSSAAQPAQAADAKNDLERDQEAQATNFHASLYQAPATTLSRPPIVATPLFPGQAPTSTPTKAPAQQEVQAETQVYQPGPISTTGVDISRGQLAGIPAPKVSVSNISFVPTVLIPQKTGLGTDKIDVSLLDDFIKEVSPNARHYPPNFPNRTQRYNAREKIKVLTDWIEPYAKASDASYEVLLRAAKLNGMGRNLDLGSDFAVRGGQYVDRAIKLKPDSAEANFLYGMMLSEGGGFKEGQKYLDRAVKLGYVEAEQSLAQSDLLSDKKSQALERLQRLQQQHPENAQIPKQIQLIEEGKYYIWDLPSSNIAAKP